MAEGGVVRSTLHFIPGLARAGAMLPKASPRPKAPFCVVTPGPPAVGFDALSDGMSLFSGCAALPDDSGRRRILPALAGDLCADSTAGAILDTARGPRLRAPASGRLRIAARSRPPVAARA